MNSEVQAWVNFSDRRINSTSWFPLPPSSYFFSLFLLTPSNIIYIPSKSIWVCLPLPITSNIKPHSVTVSFINPICLTLFPTLSPSVSHYCYRLGFGSLQSTYALSAWCTQHHWHLTNIQYDTLSSSPPKDLRAQCLM